MERLELAKAIHCEAQSNVLRIATVSSGMGRRGPASNRGLGMEPVRRHWVGHVWSSSDRFSRPPDQSQGIELTWNGPPAACGLSPPQASLFGFTQTPEVVSPGWVSGYLSEMRK
jgi:hypothetical protein